MRRRLVRPYPRRNPGRYPVGTLLTLRDGRTFEVLGRPTRVWDDPTEGNGGGDWITVCSHVWVLIGEVERRG